MMANDQTPVEKTEESSKSAEVTSNEDAVQTSTTKAEKKVQSAEEVQSTEEVANSKSAVQTPVEKTEPFAKSSEVSSNEPKVEKSEEPAISAEVTINGHQPEESADFEVEEEFAKLRCSSVQTEIICERHRAKTQARQPSPGYPGLAFGSSLFSSGTIMKFRIISNELHNIQNVQLKRAEGEVTALFRRIELLEADLEKSNEVLKVTARELEGMTQEMHDEDERSVLLNQELIKKYISMLPDSCSDIFSA